MTFKVCKKVSSIHSTFKKIFNEILNSEIEKYPKDPNNDFTKNKMFGLARISIYLLYQSFIELKTLQKILEILKNSIACLVSILVDNSKIIKNLDLDTFLKLTDFVYEKRLQGYPETREEDKNFVSVCADAFLLNYFDKLSNDAIITSFDGCVFPSFRYAFSKVLAKQEFKNYFKVEDPIECAKFLSLAAAKYIGLSKEMIEFLKLLRSLKNHQKTLDEVVKLIKEQMEEIYLSKKVDEDSDKTTTVTIFAGSLFSDKFMNISDYLRCLEVVMDAMAEPNHTTSICMQYICLTTMDELKQESNKKIYDRLHSILSVFGGFEEKIFEKVEVSERALEFSELKSKKVETAAQMIFDSVLKVHEENQEFYLVFCNHIQKYKFNFKNSLKDQVQEKTVTLVICPFVESFDWKKIKKFAKFLLRLEKDFKIVNGKLFFVKKFFEEIFTRFEDEKRIDNWIEFIKTFRELTKDYAEILVLENVWILDIFFQSEFRKCPRFDNLYKDLDFVLNLELTPENPPNPETDFKAVISPSFTIYINHLKTREIYKENVVIGELQAHAKYFIQNAAEEHENSSQFIKQLLNFKKMRATDFKFKNFNEVQFLEGVLRETKEIFEEFFFGKSEGFKPFAYGLCKFISNLYINALISSKEFEYFVDEIIKATRKKTTELNIHCYHAIVVAPMSEMKKKKDEEIFKKSIESQNEFSKFLGTIGLNQNLFKAKNLDNDKILDVAGPSNAKAIVAKMKEQILAMDDVDEM